MREGLEEMLGKEEAHLLDQAGEQAFSKTRAIMIQSAEFVIGTFDNSTPGGDDEPEGTIGEYRRPRQVR